MGTILKCAHFQGTVSGFETRSGFTAIKGIIRFIVSVVQVA